MTEYTSKEDEEYFASIGRLTISWAYIEAGLDICVILFYNKLGGSKFAKTIPLTLSKKIDLLRKCANQLPVLEPWKDRLVAILDAVVATSELRHDVIHSFVISHFLEKPRRTVSLRLMRTATTYYPKRVELTTLSVMKDAVDASKLGGQAIALGEELAGKFWTT